MGDTDAEVRRKGELEFETGYGSGPFGIRELRVGGAPFNPVVSVLAALVLWGLVIGTTLNEEKAAEDFAEGRSWVTRTFTWLYIASQDYWLVFLIPLCYYYGHVKLGMDDEKPEFDDLSYFCMVFCAGVAIGLVFYGASEPLWHMTTEGGNNRYSNDGYSNENQIAQNAINVTLFHWGLQAWVVYALAAVSMGILSYRMGLPLCFRTTLAPLFGKATWGWFGDMLDVITIVTIVFGLCTSLGLGAKQIVVGLQRLGILDSDLDDDGFTNCETWTIAIVTGFATLSVISGLNYGIKFLSQTAFLMGNFILLTVFFLDEPWYLLNLMVQSAGFHMQHFLEISFYTDAFAQFTPGSGRPNDDKGAAAAWMNWWTIFYWGWWIAWAPFVGVFFARISRGRTVREFINGTILVPVLYNFAWFIVFGGAGLRMEMLADQNGITCDMSDPVEGKAQAGYSRNICRSTGVDRYTGEKILTCSLITKLSCSPSSEQMLFDLMFQYGDMGWFLCGITMLSLVLYFVTSSDSGSMVDDIVTANGIPEQCLVQRLWWALTEGMAATALLYCGRFIGTPAGGLKALQAASICVGLPYTFLICFMCLALWRGLEYEFKDRSWTDGFKVGILDVGLTLYTAQEGPDRCCNVGAGYANLRRIMEICTYIVWPFPAIYRAAAGALRASPKEKQQEDPRMPWKMAIGGTLCLYLAIAFLLLDVIPIGDAPYQMGSKMGEEDSRYWMSKRFGTFHSWNKVPTGSDPIDISDLTSGLSSNFDVSIGELAYEGTGTGPGPRIGSSGRLGAIGWFFFLAFVTLCALLRFNVRTAFNISGNLGEDFLFALIWPMLLFQVTQEVKTRSGSSENFDEEESSVAASESE